MNGKDLPKRKMSGKKTALIVAVSIIALVLILSIVYFFTAGAILFRAALDPTFDMGAALNGGGAPEPGNRPDEENEWWDACPKAERTISSDDGLRLVAYEFKRPEPSDRWLIAIHGYRGNARTMSAVAKRYFDQGFNVLAPDLRAHGKSEGEVIGMGWIDRFDMLGWIDLVVAEHPDSKIVLHGVSMGGATVMMTVGETLPKNVKAAVEDCGYTSVYDQFSYVSKTVLNIPPFFTMPEGRAMISIKTGRDIKKESSLTQLKKSVTPTLFIHGTEDTFVPFSMLQENFDAAASEKEILKIDGAGHALSATVDSDLYYSTVFAFVNRRLSTNAG